MCFGNVIMSFWRDVPFEFWTMCCLESCIFDTSHQRLAHFSTLHVSEILWDIYIICFLFLKKLLITPAQEILRVEKVFRISYVPAILLDVSVFLITCLKSSFVRDCCYKCYIYFSSTKYLVTG